MKAGGSEIIIYQTGDGKTRIDVRMEGETVWLSLDQMADLFQRDKSTVSRHIRNIFEEGELQRQPVVAKFATTAADGKIYQVDYYNLDVIISVGYRVKSLRGTQFRIWANQVLKEYLVKGFAMNHEPMYMKDRVSELDSFADRYGKGILEDAGKVSHKQALEKAEREYEKYRQKTLDALSPVEIAYIESIKETQKKLERKK
jgi:hypothetical protein